MAGILFVYRRDASFIAIDRDLLRERWQVTERRERRPLVNVFGVARAVRRCDLVFGWFAYWHTFWPVTFAWLMRKPSVLVVGGFDTANMPAAGYGLQQKGLRRTISRWTMKRAGHLIVNSFYIRDELERNTGISGDRVTVVHHGLADRFGSQVLDSPREAMALTVGVVDRANLVRKGLRAFAEAATLLPDVEFVLAGRWDGDAVERLRSLAAPNLRLTGWIEDDQLEALYRSAGVYVQASIHEGFGMSVAEAMLAGCIPVTSSAGALPEVVGDVGVQVAGDDRRGLAQAIERALALGGEERRRARERVLQEFTLDSRRTGIQRVVERALERSRTRS